LKVTNFSSVFSQKKHFEKETSGAVRLAYI